MSEEATQEVTPDMSVNVDTSAINTQPQAEPSEASAQTEQTVDYFQSFKDQLPEDLKGHSYLEKYKTPEDFVKAGINHQSALTKKASEYFTSDDPEVVAERNKAMGVPESVDGYALPEELSSAVSDESLFAFKEMALAEGLPAKYLPKLVEFEAGLWTKHAENVAAEAAQAKEATESELREGWKGDAYEKNISNVTKFLTNELGLTPEEFNQPLGNNTKLLRGIAEKIIPEFGEDRLIEGSMTQSVTSTQDSIMALNKRMHSTERNSPEYKALLNEKLSLMQKIT